MRNYQDGGEAIIEAFRNLGIKYVISSPGSEWSPAWEALTRQKVEKKPGPQYVQCWHETLAVNMATGYTFMTGEPQAVLLHAGVGLLQGAMGIRCALQAEVPMVVMSGESTTLGEDPEREMEQQWYGGVSPGGADRLVSSFTKYAAQVPSSPTLYQSIIRAGEMAQRVPQGPVYLDVPLEYMLDDWTPPGDLKMAPRAPKPQAAPEDLEGVARQLAEAKNPMVVVEMAGRDPKAFSALVELAEALGMPVIGGRGTSFANFPTDHPLWQGVGNYDPLAEADLVLLVSGRTPWFPPSRRPTPGRIISVSDHSFKDWLIYQNLQADEYLEGDVAGSLAALAKAVKAAGPDAGTVKARADKWRATHDEMEAKLKAARDEACQEERLDTLAVCAAVSEVMPDDTIYADETITHFPIVRQHLRTTRPQTLFRHSGGALGQGLGLALGLKMAAPDRPVVLFIGDGALLYNPVIQAFGASKEHDLPIIVVVMNNGGYKAMHRGHVKFYPEGMVTETELEYGVKIDKLDFETLGSQFGFPGERAETYAEFKSALENAKAAAEGGRTAIIHAVLPA